MPELSEVLFDRVQQFISHLRHSLHQEESADSAWVSVDWYWEVLFDERELLAYTGGFGRSNLLPVDDSQTNVKARLSRRQGNVVSWKVHQNAPVTGMDVQPFRLSSSHDARYDRPLLSHSESVVEWELRHKRDDQNLHGKYQVWNDLTVRHLRNFHTWDLSEHQ